MPTLLQQVQYSSGKTIQKLLAVRNIALLLKKCNHPLNYKQILSNYPLSIVEKHLTRHVQNDQRYQYRIGLQHLLIYHHLVLKYQIRLDYRNISLQGSDTTHSSYFLNILINFHRHRASNKS